MPDQSGDALFRTANIATLERLSDLINQRGRGWTLADGTHISYVPVLEVLSLLEEQIREAGGLDRWLHNSREVTGLNGDQLWIDNENNLCIAVAAFPKLRVGKPTPMKPAVTRRVTARTALTHISQEPDKNAQNWCDLKPKDRLVVNGIPAEVLAADPLESTMKVLFSNQTTVTYPDSTSLNKLRLQQLWAPFGEQQDALDRLASTDWAFARVGALSWESAIAAASGTVLRAVATDPHDADKLVAVADMRAVITSIIVVGTTAERIRRLGDASEHPRYEPSDLRCETATLLPVVEDLIESAGLPDPWDALLMAYHLRASSVLYEASYDKRLQERQRSDQQIFDSLVQRFPEPLGVRKLGGVTDLGDILD